MSSPTHVDPDIQRLSKGVLAGERRSLGRAITLIESGRADHQQRASALLALLLPHAGKAVRLGITGPPGAGKSTFIEAFGLHLVEQGKRVAVLAIDPSSVRSGGSILGDKTRMEELSRNPAAFIRPSPSGGTLGGVARRTREAMLACEAAGYDVVIVETVGVGQSETAMAAMVDMFVLLLSPGGGDELQGIKRGIMELADLVVVNKADGDLKAAAGRFAAEYAGALGLMRPSSPLWTPEVLICSSLEQTGMDKVWAAAGRHREAFDAADALTGRRAEQAKKWLWGEIEESLVAAFRHDPRVGELLDQVETEVAQGRITPSGAAAQLMAAFRGGNSAE
jgi:LAO/AO transport system kinase